MRPVMTRRTVDIALGGAAGPRLAARLQSLSTVYATSGFKVEGIRGRQGRRSRRQPAGGARGQHGSDASGKPSSSRQLASCRALPRALPPMMPRPCCGVFAGARPDGWINTVTGRAFTTSASRIRCREQISCTWRRYRPWDAMGALSTVRGVHHVCLKLALACCCSEP